MRACCANVAPSNYGTDSDESTDLSHDSGFHAAGLEALDHLGQGVLGIKGTKQKQTRWENVKKGQ